MLYKHDESQIAGTIQSLGYDDRGNLRICAEVTHDLAKRCNAFSIGARILEYSLVDTDTENFHALITSAEITEISLTDRPANPHALVRSRGRVTPMNAYLGLLGERADLEFKVVEVLKRELKVLQQIFSTPTPPAPRPQRRPPVTPRPVEPHRASAFGRLISAMEERAQ